MLLYLKRNRRLPQTAFFFKCALSFIVESFLVLGFARARQTSVFGHWQEYFDCSERVIGPWCVYIGGTRMCRGVGRVLRVGFPFIYVFGW